MMELSNSIEIPNKRYFTIGEVSKITHIKTHILRYWEKEFNMLEPTKREETEDITLKMIFSLFLK